MKLKISVVIPCYGSGDWLPEIADGIHIALADFKHEIIFVNDCSPDHGVTWNSILQLVENGSGIIGIDLQKNVGQTKAILAGMAHSDGDIVVLMDDDLQHSPSDIPELISPICSGRVDCSIASFSTKKHSLFRNLGSRLVRFTYRRLHSLPSNIVMSSFRSFTRDVNDLMLRNRTSNPVLGAILLRSARTFENVDITHHPRKFGASGYKVGKLVKATLDNIFLATTFPLRIFSYIGLIISAISILGSAYYATQFILIGTAVPGFTTLVLLQLFLIGITSIGLGLMGEYIDRILDEVDHRPRWHIREKVESDKSEDNEGQLS